MIYAAIRVAKAIPQFWFVLRNTTVPIQNPNLTAYPFFNLCVQTTPHTHDGVLLQGASWSRRLHYLHGSRQVRERGAHQIRFSRRYLVTPTFILIFVLSVSLSFFQFLDFFFVSSNSLLPVEILLLALVLNAIWFDYQLCRLCSRGFCAVWPRFLHH